MLVLILYGARLHHSGHAVAPLDLFVLENLDHVDVDEIDTQLHALHAALLHLLLDGLGKLANLLRGGCPGGALDPGVGVADLVFRDPRRMLLDMHSDVALLEQYRSIVAAKQRVAETRLQSIPTGSQCAGDVTNVLVVHEQHRAQAVRLHPLARALQPVFTQPIPINALLPIQSYGANVCQIFPPVRTAYFIKEYAALSTTRKG